MSCRLLSVLFVDGLRSVVVSVFGVVVAVVAVVVGVACEQTVMHSNLAVLRRLQG